MWRKYFFCICMKLFVNAFSPKCCAAMTVIDLKKVRRPEIPTIVPLAAMLTRICIAFWHISEFINLLNKAYIARSICICVLALYVLAYCTLRHPVKWLWMNISILFCFLVSLGQECIFVSFPLSPSLVLLSIYLYLIYIVKCLDVHCSCRFDHSTPINNVWHEWLCSALR